MAELLDILLDFQFQGSQDHPTGAFPGQFIQRLSDFRSFSFDGVCGKLEHGVSFPRPLWSLLGVYLLQGYAAFIVLAIYNFQ